MILIIVCFFTKTKTIGQEINFTHVYKHSAEIKDISDNQLAAFFLSTIGKYDKALLTYNNSEMKKGFQIDSVLAAKNGIDTSFPTAKEYIICEAKSKDYVILNEAHHIPRHRVFAKSLLKELYDIGYRNLAIETLSTNQKYIDTLLNERKYPLATSGSYSREPQFGDFIRKALEIGYNVFPYDNLTLPPKEREKNGAKEIIKRQKKGKTLIYCGFQHALEGKVDFWEYALAENIKILTNSDPLTIDQTTFSEREIQNSVNKLDKNFTNLEARIVFNQNKEVLSTDKDSGYYDIKIIHPKTRFIKNRPDWIFDAYKKPFKVNIDDIDIERPFFLMAFKKEENFTNAVPLDILEIDNYSVSPVYLSLQEGKYDLIFTKNDNKGLRKAIEVK